MRRGAGGYASEPRSEPAYRNPYGDDRGYPAFGFYEEGYRPARREPLPKVEVKSPRYYDYVPDKPVETRLDDVCQVQIASNAAAPAPESFTHACALSSSITLRALPEVGKALGAYYSAHPDFVWVEQGTVNAKALAAMKELARSDRFGLEPADYRVALPAAQAGDARLAPAAALRFDLALSAKVMTYVLDARRGRVDPNRISGYHDLPRKSVDLAAALLQIAQADDTAAALARQNPDNPRFRALVAQFAKLQSEATQHVVIPNGTFISPGDTAPALGAVLAAIVQAASPELKQKHADALAKAGSAAAYTPDLVALVRDFQHEQGLAADGIVGKSTISALTADSITAKIQKIRLAMERLRWLPRSLGDRYVFLNEPAFRVAYVNGDAEPLTMRAVIGKPSTQTNFFAATIKDVVFNPYWNVPRSIIVNEMLPRLWRDPSYLDRLGYEISDARGRDVASAAVDWAGVAANHVGVDVRQPPGRKNALGRVKIEFPNSHAIYMHDTPEKSLFEHDRRAFSHGCVRLQHPREMAAALLGTDVEHVDRRIAQGGNSSEPVAGGIPVYLGYFTAWPDHNGVVNYYADVYGRDGYLQKALDKTEAARRS